MGNIRPQMIFVPKPELRVKRRGMGGWVFQVTTQNMLLFISCQGILSKFLYIKPNPYYRHFSALEFSEGFSAPKFLIWLVCGYSWLDASRSPLKIFSFLSHLRGYFQNYHMSSQTHITAFFVHWGSYVTSLT